MLDTLIFLKYILATIKSLHLLVCRLNLSKFWQENRQGTEKLVEAFKAWCLRHSFLMLLIPNNQYFFQ